MAIHAIKEFAPDEEGRGHSISRRAKGYGGRFGAKSALGDECSREDARPEDDRSGENDFPGAHQMSTVCSASANTVDSSVAGSLSLIGQKDHSESRAVITTQAAAARQSARPQRIQAFGATPAP